MTRLLGATCTAEPDNMVEHVAGLSKASSR